MSAIGSVGAATAVSGALVGQSGGQALPTVLTSIQPAVVVNISSAVSAPVNIGSADPTKVGTLLATVGAANGFADAYAHADWDNIDAGISSSKAESERNGLANAIAIEQSEVASQASSLGLTVQSSTSAASDGTSPPKFTFFTVGAFSFTSNGSTYTVTPGSNGTLNGTKDGQYWQTWQIADPNQSAISALKTLTAVAAGSLANSTKLDLSL